MRAREEEMPEATVAGVKGRGALVASFDHESLLQSAKGRFIFRCNRKEVEGDETEALSVLAEAFKQCRVVEYSGTMRVKGKPQLMQAQVFFGTMTQGFEVGGDRTLDFDIEMTGPPRPLTSTADRG